MKTLNTFINIDNISRQASIDIYANDSTTEAVLYFPLTQEDKKYIPYFSNPNHIRPFNMKEIPLGASLLPSLAQAGKFYKFEIKNLACGISQKSDKLDIKFNEDILKLMEEFKEENNQTQLQAIKLLESSDNEKSMWHGEPAHLSFKSNNDARIGNLTAELMLKGNENNEALYINWILDNHSEKLKDLGN